METIDTTPVKPIVITSINQDKWDDTFRLMSWWKTERIKAAQVMVVGCGALGNEVLKNLALLGIGKIVVVDFDRVEYSNLSRSVLFRHSDSKRNLPKAEVVARRVREINPEVQVKIINGDLIVDVGLGVFRRMDVVIGCLDNKLARLYINKYAFWMGKTWVDGGIQDLAGQLNVYRPGVACYESGLSKLEQKFIEERLSCATIARRYASEGRVPTTPISSSIIAAMQVQEALKVINGNDQALRLGKTFYYEGLSNMTHEFTNTPPSPTSESSYTIPKVIEVKSLSADTSIADALTWLRKRFKTEKIAIHPRHRIITEMVCLNGQVLSTLKAFPHLPEEGIVTKELFKIDHNFPDPSLSLRDVGIPYLDVIEVKSGMNRFFVELTGDAKKFLKYR